MKEALETNPTPEQLRLVLRVHTRVKRNKKRSQKKRKKRRSRQVRSDLRDKWAKYVLVLDTECTTNDNRQSLTFGMFRFCELQGDGNYTCQREGIFYADRREHKFVELLRNFVQSNPAETMDDCPKRIDVLRQNEFVRTVLKSAFNQGACIVCFNSPFDLSRLALEYRETRQRGAGWSLIFRRHRNRRVRRVLPDCWFPRLRMVPKDSRSAFIDLSSGDLERVEYKGRFLDLSVLAYALRSEHRTLDDWCEHFKIGRKMPHVPTGKITTDEVKYCRNDVRITVALLNALKREYDTFPLDLKPERAMSAASIAKAYLDKIGLELPSKKFKLSDQLLGRSMSAYYGGRAEIRIRHTEVPVVFCDFTSEYPTVQTLLGNWNVLIAHKVEVQQCTVEVQRLLETITPERVLDKSLWRDLGCFALVKADGDILPVRTCYGDKVSTNIGLNPLCSDKPIWYAVPDLVGSVLLAKKVPAVLKAFRLVPVGVQKDLRCTSLGNREIDPEAEDFFRAIIEERKRLPDEDPGQHLLKILANAGAYGIWAELNKESYGRNNLKQLHVCCGEQEFTETTPSFEKPGPWYFPPIAALITAAGRLLLALLERMVTDLGGTYLMTDTDSMAIVSTEKGGLVPCAGGSHRMPDGRAAIRALTWDQVRQITAQFNRLNPYDTSAVKNILKVEKINFDRNGKQHQLYGFAISAKRYDLYLRRPNSTVQILKPSEHGLGHLYFPDTRKRYVPKDCLNQKDSYPQWIVEAWEYLVRFHAVRTRVLKHGMEEEPLDSAPEWSSRMAMMNMRITTPNVLVNLRKLDREMARPFNFFHMPVLRGNPNCTLIAPFNKDSSQWETQNYIDINTGKIVKLGAHFKGSFVLGMSFLSVIKDYYEHNESKSLAPDGSKSGPDTAGLLRRYPVEAITPFRLMGKEVERKASDGPDISMFAEPCRYIPYRGKVVASRETRTELGKIPLRKQVRDTGLSHHTLLLIQRGEAVKKKTLQKVNAYLQTRTSKQNN